MEYEFKHTCSDGKNGGGDGECLACGMRDCPHKEPFHYHHDGCPECDSPWRKGNKKVLELTRTSIVVIASDGKHCHPDCPQLARIHDHGLCDLFDSVIANMERCEACLKSNFDGE